MKLLKYITRWQLSTPILAIVPITINYIYPTSNIITNEWIIAGIANLIGSLIFFKLDEKIFTNK